jgi:nicotinamidase/pyrazinamidase
MLGLHTVVIQDACEGVNLSPDDSNLALDEMRRAGVFITNSEDIFLSR